MTDANRNQKSNLVIAYHEAGHAVMERLVGRKNVSIRMFHSGRSENRGQCMSREGGSTYERLLRDVGKRCPQIWDAAEIATLHAGLWGECIVSDDFDLSGTHGDIGAVGSILREAGHADNDRLHHALLEVSRYYVFQHADQVKLLAEALLADGRIVKGKQIRRILGNRTVPLRDVLSNIADAWNAYADVTDCACPRHAGKLYWVLVKHMAWWLESAERARKEHMAWWLESAKRARK
jgi:hypothetical protein